MDSRTNVAVIKEYFSAPGRAVTIDEMKALTGEDWKELAALITAEQAMPREAAA